MLHLVAYRTDIKCIFVYLYKENSAHSIFMNGRLISPFVNCLHFNQKPAYVYVARNRRIYAIDHASRLDDRSFAQALTSSAAPPSTNGRMVAPIVLRCR